MIRSNSLGDLEFRLVDGFMNDLKLLSPMYLTIHVEAIPDETLIPYYFIPNRSVISSKVGEKPENKKQPVKQEIPPEKLDVGRTFNPSSRSFLAPSTRVETSEPVATSTTSGFWSEPATM